jgi:hypothetical protein
VFDRTSETGKVTGLSVFIWFLREWIKIG